MLDVVFYESFTEQKVEKISKETFTRGEILSVEGELTPYSNIGDGISSFGGKRKPFPEEVRRGQAVAIVVEYKFFTPEEAE